MEYASRHLVRSSDEAVLSKKDFGIQVEKESGEYVIVVPTILAEVMAAIQALDIEAFIYLCNVPDWLKHQLEDREIEWTSEEVTTATEGMRRKLADVVHPDIFDPPKPQERTYGAFPPPEGSALPLNPPPSGEGEALL